MGAHIVRRALVALAWLVGAALPAQACSIPIPDAGAALASWDLAVVRLRNQDCLGHARNDPAPLVTRFNALTEEPVVMNQTDRLLRAIDLLVAEAVAGSAGVDEADSWKAMLLELGRARGQLASLKNVQTQGTWIAAMQAAIEPKWRSVASNVPQAIALGGTPVRLSGPVACEDGRPCPAFQSRIGLLRVANLMARLERYAQDSSLDRQFAESELALKQWEAYRARSHHQYIWEVAINGARMGDDLCPRDAGTGMKIGFCRVPTSQLIVLHPEAALRFSRNAAKASELKPAIVVELLGWYGWEWARADGRDTAEMVNRRGLSLAATYTSTDNEKRWAYGPMLHYGDYSLALTRAGSGGKWSIVLNLSLGERWFGRKQQVVDELAKVRKTDVLELLLR